MTDFVPNDDERKKELPSWCGYTPRDCGSVWYLAQWACVGIALFIVLNVIALIMIYVEG